MKDAGVAHATLARVMALGLAGLGLALSAYVEFAKTSGDAAAERFGWFVYESAAWLALLCIGAFAPLGMAAVVGALAAFGLEVFAYWSVFVQDRADDATMYLWKPLAQIALVAGAVFGGYLRYLQRQREAARG